MNLKPDDKPALPLEELEITPQWVKTPVRSYENHSGEQREERGRGFRTDPNRSQRQPSRGRDTRRTGQETGRTRPPRTPGDSARPPRGAGGQSSGAKNAFRARSRPAAAAPVVLPRAEPLLEVAFIAEDQGLTSMIEAMKQSPRAYALFDLARLILNKPERHLVKLKRKAAADGSHAPLYLVRPSENPFPTKEEALRFLFRRHADLIFKEHKKPIDPPHGNFAFVNRCGHTGVLLGPPNYHEYQNRLVRHHQQRLAHVPFDQFKARIQTVRDTEVIKAWIESMSFRFEYEYLLPPADPALPVAAVTAEASTPQPAAPAPSPKLFATRDEAEKYFIEHDLPRLVETAPELRISGQASRKIEHAGILEAIRLAWETERKFPLNTANGLRSRLRKEGFHFFKHKKGITYITIVRPKRFESLDGLTEPVQKIVRSLRAHQECSRKEVVEQLSSPTPTGAEAEAEKERLLADLWWLVMEGYVVEFSDGRLWALEDKPAAPAPVEPAPVASATNDPSRVSQPLAGAEPAAPTPSANLAHKIGIIHYNLDGFSFPQFLQFAAEAGCQSVELQLADVWGNGVDDPEKNAERLNKEIAAHGLSVSALAAHNDFVQLEEATIDSQVERMKRICGLGRILNPEAVIRAEGGAPKENVPKEKWLEAMRGCFSRCMEFLDDMKMSLAIDNHGLITNDGDLLHTLLEQLNCKRIGTNLDTMNYRWFGHDIATCNRFYELMAPHALHTHIKDGFGSRENYRGAALGEGEIDLSYALRCLEKAGYQGVYCAEYEGPELLDGAGYRKCCQWLARTRNR